MSISPRRGPSKMAISKYGQKRQKLAKSRKNGLSRLIWASYQKILVKNYVHTDFEAIPIKKSQFSELFKFFRISL